MKYETKASDFSEVTGSIYSFRSADETIATVDSDGVVKGIASGKTKITVFDIIHDNIHDKQAFFFIDPPYTKAGHRLYTLHDINHHKLFELVSKIEGRFLMTYDDTPEVRDWADEFGLPYTTIPMQTTHLIKKEELLISDRFDWMN